jgi:hypothetical protein
MRDSWKLSLLTGAVALAAATQPGWTQQSAANPVTAACGPDAANYVVKKDPTPRGPVQAPADKALVYVIEVMPHIPFLTSKVNIGFDGRWVGATEADGFLNITLDPGEHHACAVYQGHAEGMDAEGQTLLLHLTVEAGKTYYLRYHAFFVKDAGGIAFFEPVDADEGELLLQRSRHVTSTEKK